jgi:hypothetical protein
VALLGVYNGRPYLDLEACLTSFVDLTQLDEVHEEICVGLARVPRGYTGGSHRSMGITPPSRADDVGVDYGEVIAELDAAGFARLRSLAADPDAFPERHHAGARYGEERDVPLSRAQLLWLEARHHVYFPWKCFVELMPVARWDDKDALEGKQFTWEAETFFARTVAFLRALPLEGIGRASIMGMSSFDHGTVHRDASPDPSAPSPRAPAEFIMLCPGRDKRLFLWDPDEHREIDVDARAYWFNDGDYHGVRSAPHFRYSVRVDGPFTEAFRRKLREAAE